MPKRRRMLTPLKRKSNKPSNDFAKDRQDITPSSTPRGRLKGALKDALDPAAEESDESCEATTKRNVSEVKRRKSETSSSSEDDYEHSSRTPYVLKLFDRSVDLSQFPEDSPLYPICRAWMLNQPKMCYRKFSKKKNYGPEPTEESVELPGPVGPPISRIPKLTPEQEASSKENINLNYRSAPSASREALLSSHLSRWAAVRRAWLAQAAQHETRYSATQDMLNKINVISNGI